MSITIKAGPGFDAPWISVPVPMLGELNDTPAKTEAWQKEYLALTFGIEVEGLTLAEATINAALHFGAMGRAGEALGAKAVTDTKPAAQQGGSGAPAASQGTSDVQVEQTPAEAPKPEAPEVPEHQHQGVLDKIAAATTKAEVSAIVRDPANKDALKDKSVVDVAKARLGELK